MTNNKTEGVLDKLYNYIREELMFSTESGRQPREGKNVAYYNVLEAIEDLKKNMETPSPPEGVENYTTRLEYLWRDIDLILDFADHDEKQKLKMIEDKVDSFNKTIKS